jgi:hypothetical protein
VVPSSPCRTGSSTSLAASSTCTAGAGHVIQETHPQAVVDAVDEVLAKIRR